MSIVRQVLLFARAIASASQALAAAFVALAGLSSALTLGFILTTGALVGSIPEAINGNRARMTTWLVLVAALFVAEHTIGPFRNALSMGLGSRLSAHLHERVMRAALEPEGIAHLEDPELADDLSRCRDIEWEVASYSRGVQEVGRALTSMLEGLGAAVVLSRFRWWAPLPLLAAWGMTHFWLARDEEILAEMDENATPERRRFAYYLHTAMRAPAAKEMRIFQLTDLFVTRYATHWLAVMTDVWRARKLRRGTMVQTLLAIAGSNAIVFLALGAAAVDGAIELAGVAVFAQAALTIERVGYLNGADWWILRGSAKLPVLDRLERRGRERGSLTASTIGAETVGPPVDSIAFDHVSFAYPRGGPPVFESFELAVPAGHSLAIVGANGAGKTTLIKLLCRLYDPSSGSIRVDGRDVREIGLAGWRRQIAVIFQDFVRLDLSVRANVAAGRLDLASVPGALEEAAEKAGLAQFVARLPDGWDTPMSAAYPGGVNPSGGEWQRIALARAFLAVRGGASVLVLDEPTAHLDVRAEAELFDRFLDLTRGLTTILISHRFGTVRHAERIAVIDDGRIVESGSHDDLLAAAGRYAQLFALQAGRFASDGATT